MRSWGGNKDLPKLSFSLNTYNPTVTTVQFNSSAWADSIETKIFENYLSQFIGHTLDVINENMSEYYIRKSQQFLARVNSRYLYGVTIEQPNITGEFKSMFQVIQKFIQLCNFLKFGTIISPTIHHQYL